MQLELMGVEQILRRWKERPRAAVNQLSPFSADAERTTGYTRDEIKEMKRWFAKRVPSRFAALFPNERDD